MEKICKKFNLKIRLVELKPNGKQKITFFNEGLDLKTKTYNIGLLAKHYFLIEEVAMTEFALKNYFGILEKVNKWEPQYYRYLKNKPVIGEEIKTITSFRLVTLLLDNKITHLKELTLEDGLLKTTQINSKDCEITNLEYFPDSCDLVENKIEQSSSTSQEFIIDDDTSYQKIFFDFEAGFDYQTEIIEDFFDGISRKPYKEQRKIHIPYLVHKLKYNNIKETTNVSRAFTSHETFFGYDCGLKFLESLRTDTLLIAHNTKYDFSFLLKHLIKINECSRQTEMMQVKAEFYNKKTHRKIKLIIKDSYKLIKAPLIDFPKMFFTKEEQLKIQKEIMPYDFYTKDNIDKRVCKIDEAIKHLYDDQHKQFLDNINEWGCLSADKTSYDIIKYSEEYCKIDCEILAKGYETFRRLALEVTNLNTDRTISLASLAHQFFCN